MNRIISFALAAILAFASLPALAAPIPITGSGPVAGENIPTTAQDGSTVNRPAQVVVLADEDGNYYDPSTSADAAATQAPPTYAAATATKSQLAGCTYLSSLPSPSTTQQGSLVCGPRGALNVTLQDTSGNNLGQRSSLADNFTFLNALSVVSHMTGFDGTTYDRIPGTAENGLVVQDWALPTSRWSYAPPVGGISNTTTAVTMKAAAGAGLRNYVKGCWVDASALGAATEVVIRDGAGGTVLWRGYMGTSGWAGRDVVFHTPLMGTANTLIEVATLTATVTGNVYFNCQGFVGP